MTGKGWAPLSYMEMTGQMKVNMRLPLLALVLLLAISGISAFAFRMSGNVIEQGYLASECKSAENLAVLVASTIHLSGEQVDVLKQCSYDELQATDENKALLSLVSNDLLPNKIDYAYVMVRLAESEVKYQVTDANTELFDAPVGTDMDILWLLDVNVSDTAANTFEKHYIATNRDVSRYSCYIAEDDDIFGDDSTSFLNKSSWGDHICGFAPLYTTEGVYIGAVGVEYQMGDFEAYRNTALWAMAAPLLVSVACLVAVFLVLYLHDRKLRFGKVYTDSLTGINNRGYYADQLPKKLNAERRHGSHLALAIADIDWFKKVNDTYGHEVGDQVLQEIAQVFADVFGDTHVCRFGGEEFVAGIWVEDEHDLQARIELLFEKIAARSFARQRIKASLSLGASYCEPDGLSEGLLFDMLRPPTACSTKRKGAGAADTVSRGSKRGDSNGLRTIRARKRIDRQGSLIARTPPHV